MKNPWKTTLSALALLVMSGTFLELIAQNRPPRDAAPIPTQGRRPQQPQPTPPPNNNGDELSIELPAEFRTIDGTYNNLENSHWGAAEEQFLRLTTVEYSDGTDSPAGADRPSAREVSNNIVAQVDSELNARGATDYLWQWGQFLDHDIDETPVADPSEAFDIEVPTGDVYFDPYGTGTQVIGMNRSYYEYVESAREQVNLITAYIDASNVYGSDEERAYALRTLDGTGQLKTSDGNLLPFNTEGLSNAPTGALDTLFLAGDLRANEQIALIAMHTLFVREHNHWAGIIDNANPDLSGEEVYQLARSIVGAEIQAITYREFLPVLLGRDAIPPYQGYRPRVNAGIANVFATAAYRVGHTMLSENLLRLDGSLNEADEGHIGLASAFFAPQEIIDNDIDSILRGLSQQQCQEIDGQLIDAVRNFLFGPPGSGGFDLASLNIQRGRDHGLADYNQVRRDYGLRPVRSFDQINSNESVSSALADTYGSIDEIDAWVGLLAEEHPIGSMVGPTLSAILRDQFIRLRDGDRFYYESIFSPRMVDFINEQTLATIIRRNTEIGSELPDNVFLINSTDQPRPQDRR